MWPIIVVGFLTASVSCGVRSGDQETSMGGAPDQVAAVGSSPSGSQAPGTAQPADAPGTSLPGDDPCAPRGLIASGGGEPLEDEVVSTVWEVSFPEQDLVWPEDRNHVYRRYENPSEPVREFDYDEDGLPDSVEMSKDGEWVAVVTRSGALTITGVQTDWSDARLDDSIQGTIPLTVGDVTGDGHQDVVVTDQGSVAVVVGGGAAFVPASVPFDQVGAAVPGWITAPVRLTYGDSGEVYSFPGAHASPGLLGDVDGDGIADVSIYNHAARQKGPRAVVPGQPCPFSAAT
ncbi:MAG: hypothetical protein KDB33_08125 [Acidimicrobiales bacterium]|nr:hypothetical protein [Acidimicrobiales bacterium]MCB1260338.1 hypothetical protein [Acidimicrobiales bacterium]